MRVPTYQDHSQSNNQTSTPDPNINIASSSQLNITMTIQSYPKSKPRTKSKKYRPIERPDGVIIECPGYQPTTSPPRQALQFEKKLRTLALPPTPSNIKPKQRHTIESITAMDKDLIAIGAHFAECGRDGYNAPNALVHAGRGGYNAPFDLRGEVPQQGRCGMMPMQRFLGEDGPWMGLYLSEP